MASLAAYTHGKRLHEKGHTSAMSNRTKLGSKTYAGGDAPEEELWVDKYAPRSFLELLSDEAINRAVVRWLKSWDAAVFGTGQAAASASRAGPQIGGQGGQHGKPLQDRRPAQRVLLMGGPPGVCSGWPCCVPLLLFPSMLAAVARRVSDISSYSSCHSSSHLRL